MNLNLQRLLGLWIGLLSTMAWASTPVVGDGDVLELLLGRSVFILEDKTGQLAFEDIQSGLHDAEFQPATRDLPGLNNPSAHFWVKVSIQNSSAQARDLILENRYPLLDYLTLYEFRPDGSH